MEQQVMFENVANWQRPYRSMYMFIVTAICNSGNLDCYNVTNNPSLLH